jgi:hypothetical protein
MRGKSYGSRGKWVIHHTAEGHPLDDLLQHNVAVYDHQVEINMAALKRLDAAIPKLEPIPAEQSILTHMISESQYSFWPTVRPNA